MCGERGGKDSPGDLDKPSRAREPLWPSREVPDGPALEDLATGTRLTGLAASGSATVESVQWIGEQALKVIYRDSEGQLSERLLYRDDEPSLELVEMGRPWSFHGDGNAVQPRLTPIHWAA